MSENAAFEDEPPDKDPNSAVASDVQTEISDDRFDSLSKQSNPQEDLGKPANDTHDRISTDGTDSGKPQDKLQEKGVSTVNKQEETITDVRQVFKGREPPEMDIIGMPGRHMQIVTDFFTTLVDTKWLYTLMVFGCGSALCWLLFAAYYYLVAHAHGDNMHDTNIHEPCFQNVKTFLSAYIYSLETMSTIGCGYFYVTEECPQAYTGVIVQSILGAAIQAGIAGLVIAKMKVFKSASETIIFSKVACIVVEDFRLKLMVRIANIRKSAVVAPHVKGLFMKTENGELPEKTENVTFTAEGGQETLLLLWPETVVHVIDEKSPFWKMTKEDFAESKFELVLIFGGISESVGANLQITSSYLPSDILWSHRFRPMLPIRSMGGQFEVDIQTFDEVYYSPTPASSAYAINKFFKSEPALRNAQFESCSRMTQTGFEIDSRAQ